MIRSVSCVAGEDGEFSVGAFWPFLRRRVASGSSGKNTKGGRRNLMEQQSVSNGLHP